MNINISRDNEGYLYNPDDWDEKLATQLAAEEQIKLTDEIWPILNYIRIYYFDNGIIPDVRHVTRFLANEWHIDKKKAKKRLFTLFPYGYVKQACKISGMKRPRSWSTG